MQSMTLHASTQLTWAIANIEAFHSGNSRIEPIHFFLSLLRIMDDAFYHEAGGLGITPDNLSGIKSVAADCRSFMGVPNERITQIRRAIRKSFPSKNADYPAFMRHRSDSSRGFFRSAIEIASEESASSLTILHLLKAILKKPSPEILAFLNEPGFENLSNDVHTKSDASVSYTGKLGRDLTRLAKENRLVPVFGREKEMKALARYLVRTSKRNVILIGEAGVGKTAIVEGLAQKLVIDGSPDFLRDLRIIQINISDLIAGTKYRGEMEERLQEVIREASAAPNLILFLDEIHLVMKSGSTGESAMDIANIMKPALSNDNLRCIGATTSEEYERYIKNDSAFMRRFQLLRVAEPLQEEVSLICRQWAKRIEDIQNVVFDEDAISAAITLSGQWIPNRCFPDKAIDLLENAAAYVKITSLSSRNIPLTKELPRITKLQIIEILEEQYGISVNVSEILDVEKIRSELKENLIGQDKAVDELAECLVALSARTADTVKPAAVFLFTGPTGVGKTFTAECLSKIIFGKDTKAFIRLNMNEFKERHELSRLIGAPPGFIGHDHPGVLFQFVENTPQGIILLDEFEKAHPEIQDYFLQIFDNGKARDSKGREADFRRHLFVMTCNVLPPGEGKGQIGFHGGNGGLKKENSRDKPIETALLKFFRREFLARCDRITEFRSLSLEDYQILFERLLTALVNDVRAKRGILIKITEEIRKHLFDFCLDNENGARGFIRRFEHILGGPLHEHLRKYPDKENIRMEWVENRAFFVTEEG